MKKTAEVMADRATLMLLDTVGDTQSLCDPVGFTGVADTIDHNRFRVAEAIGVFKGHDVKSEFSQPSTDGASQTVDATPVEHFDLDVLVALPHELRLLHARDRAIEVSECAGDGNERRQQVA